MAAHLSYTKICLIHLFYLNRVGFYFSWYFGDIERQEADTILLKETQDGIFLVRSSKTLPGNFVLCVRHVQNLMLF